MSSMENRGGFHEHHKCLLHPSAVSNESGYVKGRLCLFIEECERNVLSKQRQMPQLLIKWDSGPEESFHTSQQKKKGVDNSV